MSRIPILLTTGFLGAGKTTFILSLLSNKIFENSAIIVNEVGEIGIDQDILSQSNSGSPVLLSGGCVCCEMRNDLIYTLRDLYLRSSKGLIPPIKRIFIETTGLANPGSILKQLASDNWIQTHYRIASTFAVVDSISAILTLENYSEARNQLAYADYFVLSKLDFLSDENLKLIFQKLHQYNPMIQEVKADDYSFIENIFLYVSDISSDAKIHKCSKDCIHTETSATSFIIKNPIMWSKFSQVLDSVAEKYKNNLLRCKGIVPVIGLKGPILVQGVGSVFSPPEIIDSYPGPSGQGSITVIAKGNLANFIIDEIKESLFKD